MATPRLKHAFGVSTALQAAIEDKTIDAYDQVFLNDTQQTGWIDKNGDLHYATATSNRDHTVAGVSIGAFKDGDKISTTGKTLDEIVDMLVRKEIPPTYTAPKITIANNGGPSGVVETGSSITLKLRATFTKNDAGNLTKLAIMEGDTELGSGTASPYNYAGEARVITSNLTVKAAATYAQGPVKQTNFGKDYPDGRIPAGTIASDDFTITVSRKAFWGALTNKVAPADITSDQIRGLGNNKLNPYGALVTASDPFVVPAGSSTIVIAVPAYKTIKQIFYITANDDMTSNFTMTTIKVADARGGSNGLTDYKVYTYSPAAPTASDGQYTITLA